VSQPAAPHFCTVLHVPPAQTWRCLPDVYVCSGQSNMAFSVAVPTNDEKAEANISATYASDPGASPSGKYVSTDEAIKDAVNHPDLRFLVIGNKHDCPAPITDYYPSPGTTNSKLTLAHPWQKPNATSIGVGKDVMGGNGAGELSATCYYWGLELQMTQKIPIGLIHSSYGGSAVEDWISKETLGDGKSGPCPGPITSSMVRRPLPSALCPLPSALCPLPSALCPLPSALCPRVQRFTHTAAVRRVSLRSSGTASWCLCSTPPSRALSGTRGNRTSK